MPQGIKTQGASKNPGSAQVTSKGSKPGFPGSRLSQPQNSPSSAKAVHATQLHPGRHAKVAATANYAKDPGGANKSLGMATKAPKHHAC